MDEALIRLLEQKEFEYITIKEICETAGVNRSTFYLHYENTRDLLAETVKYMLDTFQGYFPQEGKRVISNLERCPLEEMMFITPEYLIPYLTYMKENKRVFQTAVRHAAALDLEGVYDRMFQHVFDPILERSRCPVSERAYRMAFYINGITAIIMEWLKADCRDSMDHIAGVITDCVLKR